jgi:hypothetical protein
MPLFYNNALPLAIVSRGNARLPDFASGLQSSGKERNLDYNYRGMSNIYIKNLL